MNEDILNSSMRSTQSKAGLFEESVANEQKMNVMNNRGALSGPIGGAPGRRES